MPSTPDEPLLLTPGPLTTSATVREAMRRDWGSRDTDFIAMTARVRARLVAIAGDAAGAALVAVPLQGSGTFAVEAALGTFVGPRDKVLVAVNGAYGQRMVRMCEVMRRPHVVVESAEDAPVSPASLDAALAADAGITHVAVVHCETTSGILNPLEDLAAVVARHGRRLLVDAMSAFGALPLDMTVLACDAVVASANKCLQGAPGIGFVVARREALAAAAGNAHALSLDLHDQWRGFERTGQWRFTPPTHVLAAFDRALDEFLAEGGVKGRGERYRRNCRVLVDGLRAMGFETLLPDHLQAPIIVTVRTPADPRFRFETFYDALRARGYVIYPGRLTVADSFRVGCIGHLDETDMRGALAAMRQTLRAMGVVDCRPAARASSTAAR
ncbi:MAG TPA: 2-aminoethylphosphonate--pyruvate transaminase [Candidatus Tectomicrobia bacterium]|nr:2-aminoethylphosphonate--pyruvate transaminase [Candidatus Tectomicrobia bacterium]